MHCSQDAVVATFDKNSDDIITTDEIRQSTPAQLLVPDLDTDGDASVRRELLESRPMMNKGARDMSPDKEPTSVSVQVHSGSGFHLKQVNSRAHTELR